MAYSDLLADVRLELNRDDFTDAEIVSFIRRAEARFNRILRVPAMEKSVTLVIASEIGALPNDFLDARSLYDANRVALRGMDPASFIEYSGNIPSYSLTAGVVRIAPAPTAATNYTLLYFSKIPALSTTVTTNWLLDSHPDAYLYATCLAASSRIADDGALAKWKQALDEALLEIEAAGSRNRFGGRIAMASPTQQLASVRA